MDGIIQFYYALKHASNILDYSYGMVSGSRLTREEFLALPLSCQMNLTLKISLSFTYFSLFIFK